MDLNIIVYMSQEKEARAKETIGQLKEEMINLSKLVERGAGLSMSQETIVKVIHIYSASHISSSMFLIVTLCCTLTYIGVKASEGGITANCGRTGGETASD